MVESVKHEIQKTFFLKNSVGFEKLKKKKKRKKRKKEKKKRKKMRRMIKMTP